MAWADIWITDGVDLLVGDAVLTNVDPSRQLNNAKNEILSHLGTIYASPLPEVDETSSVGLRLTLIHNRLASGRLILEFAMGSESEALHAYGNSLVQEALADLKLFGVTYHIQGASPVDPTASSDTMPGSFGGDPVSPFTTYEAFVHGNSNVGLDWSSE